MELPNNYSSSGVLTRPIDSSILQIFIKNNNESLEFQTIYIYNWDSGSAVLLQSKNFFLTPNGSTTIQYPLVVTDYNDKRNVILYEVVYGPQTPNIIVTLSTI